MKVRCSAISGRLTGISKTAGSSTRSRRRYGYGEVYGGGAAVEGVCLRFDDTRDAREAVNSLRGAEIQILNTTLEILNKLKCENHKFKTRHGSAAVRPRLTEMDGCDWFRKSGMY